MDKEKEEGKTKVDKWLERYLYLLDKSPYAPFVKEKFSFLFESEGVKYCMITFDEGSSVLVCIEGDKISGIVPIGTMEDLNHVITLLRRFEINTIVLQTLGGYGNQEITEDSPQGDE
jgi:hypothetical protein